MADNYVTHLIYGDGEFNGAGLDSFADKVNLASCGLSYTVVSIMGPQGSGKSTLLNHLFQTKFTEMMAEEGRSQTTKGVWIDKCVGIDTCMIAMDLEGNDSRERGQDETTFEKQIVVFALASSDIMMINMWCHDIGRDHAANRPLLTTIFQAMMEIFGPGRKKTLLFVIRDILKTPLEKLEPVLKEDIRKIWDEAPKSSAHTNIQLNDIFTVQVIGLPSYETDERKFKHEVAQLRKSLPRLAAGDRKDVVPGSAFSSSSQEIWKTIKMNKNLDLPSQKVMVAKMRCEKIANEKFNKLVNDKDWVLETTGPIKEDSGVKLRKILDKYLSEYDTEAEYFDKAVRDEKRDVLLEKKASDIYIPLLSRKLNEKISRRREIASKVAAVASIVSLELATGIVTGGTLFGTTTMYIAAPIFAGIFAGASVVAGHYKKLRQK